MERALKDLHSGAMTIRKASLCYGIPKSTLHDHLSGKVVAGAQPGPKRYLNDEEEAELLQWLEGCAEVGCAKSVKEVRAVVSGILAAKHGIENVIVSHGWWDRFCQRHAHLALRAGESLSYRRAMAMNCETIDGYFNHLESVLKKNTLSDRPSLIFNADETGIPLNHEPGKRVAVRGQKHVCVVTSGDKSQVTVLACMSA